MDFKYSQENRIVESSDNTMHVYWSGKITENRFKAHYTSEKKTRKSNHRLKCQTMMKF